MADDEQQILHRYLQEARDALLLKLDGLDERAARWPRTPTGTNLLGLVKHAAAIEIGYFGDCVGRPWPDPSEQTWETAGDDDPNADMYATADESLDGVVDLYRRVWAFADANIAELGLDAPAHVPWWGSPDVTLRRLVVHTTSDLARHAGQADVLRELHDGAVGLRSAGDNVPPLGADGWAAYVARLEALAQKA
ncbi:uncharacterized protein DUF664 [Sediminihabitans luteus]|uniref:Uncharacterized protein DUF664 n=1 Tax=Sediminihabitans luteus TaxID=1138585 RepID=A0A2M9D114_9CELL|nr:DinB family protein [Sediminihabitans luteus]PJJ77894.1 uncharacterized protein DUF664 [Sediminihabitans luteus]GII99749.1 hypothetical protein Slu03_21270 [Sediminihabitans luteus]